MPPAARCLALCLALLCPLFASCASVTAPSLELGGGTLLLDSMSPVGEVEILNAGAAGSTLRWSARSSSPLVRLQPASGEVRYGRGSQTLRVSVDYGALQQGGSAEFTVDIESNGGNATLPARFLMTGVRPCSSQPLAAQAATGPLAPSGTFVPGELLIGYREPLSLLAQVASGDASLRLQSLRVRDEHGLRLLGRAGGGAVERVAAADPLATAERLQRDPRVDFAHPNYYVRPLAAPDDPCWWEQWNMHGFGVSAAWQSAGAAEVVVAIIDTGVDVDHEDLRGKTLPGYDLRDRDHDPRPGSSASLAAHGTHVAGIALAEGGNGVGVAGVAAGTNVKLLPVKIFDDNGMDATVADLADAILWAAGLPVAGLPANHNPARVINLSVGAGTQRVAVVDRAAERARRSGAVLVAAAGNNSSTDGSRGVQSPANSPDVIAVGSVDDDLRRSGFSDWAAVGPTVDVMAPGGYGTSGCRRVHSTMPWNGYGCMAGTSMAAPFAAGVAALILSREPHLTPDEVATRLEVTAHYDPATMSPAEYGAGVVCAHRAVAGAGASGPCSAGE